MNKKICFVSADNGGCGKYRSYLPARYLQSSAFQTSYSFGFNPQYINHYLEQDVVILQRHCHPGLLKFIDDMHENNKQVWFDIDDMLWDIPSANIAKKGWTKDMLKGMSDIIKKCDHVTTSTDPLALYLKRLNKNVHVLPNMVEEDELLSLEEIQGKVNIVPRIMWAGSSTHAGDFSSEINSAIREILKKYDVEFYFVGYIPEEFNNSKFGNKVRYVEQMPIETYLPSLKIINPDISIMPLADNYFNMCKSNLKYLESTIAGAVSIGSDVYPYSNTIEHGATGLLCKKSSQWVAAIELLLNDSEYRNKVYANAYSDVKDNYLWNERGISQNLNKYKEIINDIR